jgi:hypothetical protein
MEIPLTGMRKTTYDALWLEPAPADLLWRNARLMLGTLADRVQLYNGELTITRNGHTLVLHQTYSRNFIDMQELLEIRRFLDQSGAGASAAPVADPPPVDAASAGGFN